MIARPLARSLASSLAKGPFGDSSYALLSLVGTFPAGNSGVPYDSTIAIVGGSFPYTYAGLDAGVQPTGLTLSIVGAGLRLSGTPTVTDVFNFVPIVRSSDGQVATSNQSVTISGAGVQRVQNGNFSSATGWNTSGAAWTIAAGVATNNTAGMFLINTLTTPLVGGESFMLSFDVNANPLVSGISVQLFNSVSMAAQVIFTDGSTTGTKTSSGTVSGAFDQLRIAAVDDAGAIIDNVSLLA